jgi:hypothetical protein
VKLRTRERPSIAKDPAELSKRRLWFVHVAQQIRERHRVERCVRKWESLRLPDGGEDPSGAPGAADFLTAGAEHRLALIHSYDANGPGGQRTGDEPGAGRHVEDPRAGMHAHLRNHPPPPPGVLAEGEDGTHALVLPRDLGE